MARLFNLDIWEELRRAGAEFRSEDYLANLTQPTRGRVVSRGLGQSSVAQTTGPT
jgi:hypothetical protein